MLKPPEVYVIYIYISSDFIMVGERDYLKMLNENVMDRSVPRGELLKAIAKLKINKSPG